MKIILINFLYVKFLVLKFYKKKNTHKFYTRNIFIIFNIKIHISTSRY